MFNKKFQTFLFSDQFIELRGFKIYFDFIEQQSNLSDSNLNQMNDSLNQYCNNFTLTKPDGKYILCKTYKFLKIFLLMI